MNICFDTLHLYYLTQYLPVYHELVKRNIPAEFLFYGSAENNVMAKRVIADERLTVRWVTSVEAANNYYIRKRPDWIIFGNGFKPVGDLPPPIKTAQLYHGIGMKSDVYQPALMEMDIRFIEGPHYTEILNRYFPDRPTLEVGYAKLDPLFGPPVNQPTVDLEKMGLSPQKPTLLYAPTFYPSSIEKMPDDLPNHFSGANLIVKPHMFTYSKKRYKNQRRLLRKWERFDNCITVEPSFFNLLPFMNAADLMISDASSALFEFAALDKPVIWCDFLKLRWTYRGIFRYRLNRRMDVSIRRYTDICRHAKNIDSLKNAVWQQLENPDLFSEKRREYTARLIGPTDGRVSERIVNYLVDHHVPIDIRG